MQPVHLGSLLACLWLHNTTAGVSDRYRCLPAGRLKTAASIKWHDAVTPVDFEAALPALHCVRAQKVRKNAIAAYMLRLRTDKGSAACLLAKFGMNALHCLLWHAEHTCATK